MPIEFMFFKHIGISSKKIAKQAVLNSKRGKHTVN